MPDPSCYQDIYTGAAACLMVRGLEEKLALTAQVAQAWAAGYLGLASEQPPRPIGEPGRPPRPELVAPGKLARRALSTPEGHGAFLHAIAHIEFTAINLAWDAVYRFRGMPREYYDDWVRVAAEEARHFTLIQDRLRMLGYSYGDFPAHNGLWRVARQTADDLLRRMALVPRLLEARGLDVTPAMIDRLEQIGDTASAEALRIILRDEVGHVACGTRWFRYVCSQRGLAPASAFRALLEAFPGNLAAAELNRTARRQAGFTDEELDDLLELSNAFQKGGIR